MNNYLTQTDLVNLKLTEITNSLWTKRLKSIIDDFKKSEFYSQAVRGEQYYNYKHDIINHKRYYYVDGVKVTDQTKPNNKLIHNFFELLVDQKAGYIAGKPITITYSKDDENKTMLTMISNVVGKMFDDFIVELIKKVSQRGVDYIHPYLDEEGNFRYTIIPGTEVIPIYDTEYQDRLLSVIRFYEVQYYDETKAELKAETRYMVEWWDKNAVVKFEQKEDNTFAMVSVTGHFQSIDQATNRVTEYSWDEVPFIPVRNNAENKSDLTPDIKSLIDAYNLVKSGWLNDLEELQELIFILKGYMGFGSGSNKLSQFLKNLKENKAIAVDENGGVDTIRSEIPVEAKKEFLKITREEIFYLGKGIDITHDKFASAPSGIALKFLYSGLDLKSNNLIRHLNYSLERFFYFVCRYINLRDRVDIDYKEISYNFNKSMIFNENEKVDILVKSEGLLSKETLIANHPLVEDVETELKRISEDRDNEINFGLRFVNASGQQ